MYVDILCEQTEELKKSNKAQEIELVNQYLSFIMKNFDKISREFHTEFHELNKVTYEPTEETIKGKGFLPPTKGIVLKEHFDNEVLEESKERFIILTGETKSPLERGWDTRLYVEQGDFTAIDEQGRFLEAAYRYEDNYLFCTASDRKEHPSERESSLTTDKTVYSMEEMIKQFGADRLIKLLSKQAALIDEKMDIDYIQKRLDEFTELRLRNENLGSALRLLKCSARSKFDN